MKLADEIKVSLVTVGCILALAIISKNILNVQLDFISQYGPSLMFITYIITRDQTKKSKKCGSALYWSLAIIAVTAAILVLYSF